MADKSDIKVFVYSQMMAEDLCRELNKHNGDDIKQYAVISITDPHSPAAEIYVGNSIRAIRRLQFYDIVTEHKIGDRILRPISMYDVSGLKDFVDRCANVYCVDGFIVHCSAGISRSAGCAAAIEKYLGLDDNVWSCDKYFPNIRVYKICCEEFGINMTNEDYIKIFEE